MALLPDVRITFKICLLTATLADKNNPSSDALLSDNSTNNQETFVEGQRVHFWWLIVVSTLHARAWSLNQNVNIKWNARDVMRLYQSLGGEVSIWPH